MLTLADFVHELVQRGSPNAVVVFKSCEEKLKFEKVMAISPATEIAVHFTGDSGSLREDFARLQSDNELLDLQKKDRDRKIETLIESAKLEKWDAALILKELEGI